MRRREFILFLGCAAAWPPMARAQDRIIRSIGILETISPELNAANLTALRRGLQELGYTEGQNIRRITDRRRVRLRASQRSRRSSFASKWTSS